MLNTLEYYSEWAGGARIPREVFRIPEAFFIHAEKAHHFLTDSMLKDAAAALVAFMAFWPPEENWYNSLKATVKSVKRRNEKLS